MQKASDLVNQALQNETKPLNSGLKANDVASFWAAMGEACGMRGIFSEKVPPRTWQHELSQFTKDQLIKVYKRYLREKPQFPPDLPTVIAWARLPMPNRYGSTQAAYNNDVTKQKKLPVLKAKKETRDKYMQMIREKLSAKTSYLQAEAERQIKRG